ncbi:MAG: RNA-binding S4 domain-containing protein [Candidatus Sericytochromatia bacterium]|nr:RNA-binding S4 domain-containing protein [Candidatus Sericytochromatia bacterium]
MELYLSSEYIELAQALKWANLVESGGHAKLVIQNGEVLLNGEVETRRGRKLRDGDTVLFNGQQIQIKDKA